MLPIHFRPDFSLSSRIFYLSRAPKTYLLNAYFSICSMYIFFLFSSCSANTQYFYRTELHFRKYVDNSPFKTIGGRSTSVGKLTFTNVSRNSGRNSSIQSQSMEIRFSVTQIQLLLFTYLRDSHGHCRHRRRRLIQSIVTHLLLSLNR